MRLAKRTPNRYRKAELGGDQRAAERISHINGLPEAQGTPREEEEALPAAPEASSSSSDSSSGDEGGDERPPSVDRDKTSQRILGSFISAELGPISIDASRENTPSGGARRRSPRALG